MKILFIYTDYSPDHARRFSLGLAQLSAAIKQAGHQTFLYHYYSIFQSLDEMETQVRQLQPDVLAYSAITNQMSNVRRMAARLEPLGIYSVLGGVHPTLLPDESLAIPGIDAICRGEGDVAFVEFLNVLQNNGDVTKIPNFWVKSGSVIHRNECRPLIEDLDTLPDPDYELFSFRDLPEYSANRSLVVAASRGCVHSCTYCCNHALRSLYPNPAKYLRYKSPAATIATIKRGLLLYPALKRVRFVDDTLSQKPSWFREFAQLYKTEVGLPYSTNDRCTSITAEISDLYAESMCFSVDLGIESGNETIRNTVMRRRMSDEQIENGFALLKSRGINVNAFNVFGMPGETMSSLLDTVRMNVRVRPYFYTNAFFQPFPGTEARKECLSQGIEMDEDFPPGFAIKPVIKLSTISENELIFVMKFFRTLVRLYSFAMAPEKTSRFRRWMERALTRVLTGGFIPYGLINRVIPTQAEFRLDHPHINRMVTAVVRKYRVTFGVAWDAPLKPR